MREQPALTVIRKIEQIVSENVSIKENNTTVLIIFIIQMDILCHNLCYLSS